MSINTLSMTDTQRIAASVLVRLAEPNHASVIAGMIRALASYNNDKSSVSAEDVLEAGFGPTPWVQLFVAERERRAVGYAAMTVVGQLQFGRKIADVHHLYVEPGQRGQAVGTHLLNAVEDAARKQNAQVLTIGTSNSNWRARTVYEKNGFKQTTSRGVKLTKPLNLKSPVR
ncbi:MAG: GNAT family N-acetyltransferase [Pseudoruegeria sp.]